MIAFRYLFFFLLTCQTVFAETLTDQIKQAMPPWAMDNFLALGVWQWMGLGAALLLGFVIKKLVALSLKGVYKIVGAKTETEWDDKIIKAFMGPTSLLVAIGVWVLSLDILDLPDAAKTFFSNVLQIVASIAIIWLLYKLVGVLADFLRSLTSKTESDLDDQLMPIIERSMKSLVVIIGALIAIQNLGINVASAIAGLGIGGLAFALAAKDTAGNLFGSFTIFMDRPFKVGDWVKIAGSHEGIVEAIGMRTTRIRTFRKTLISLPNAVVANSSIENVSARPMRRIYTKIGIEYGTPTNKIEQFVEEIRKIIDQHELATTESMQVSFTDYNASSLDIMVYFFVKVADWTQELQAKQDVYIAIMKKAEEMGIGFAFPTQTIHLAK